MAASDFSLRSLPYLDAKWKCADLYGALQSTEDLAILWNNLIKDDEIWCNASGSGSSPIGSATTNQMPAKNWAGHPSYIGANGKHYCGALKVGCTCCVGYCRPSSDCNCFACQQLDSEEPKKKNANSANIAKSNSSQVPSDIILDSWLWGPIPCN